MVTWNIFNESKNNWNGYLRTMPFFTIYQTYQWGEIKQDDGWLVVRIIGKNQSNEIVGMAQILYKKLPFNIYFFWCPGGILGEYKSFILKILKKELNYFQCYFRVSFHDSTISSQELIRNGWKISKNTIGGNMSMLLDLRPGIEKLSSNLSSNWRHNVKRFSKKNLQIELWQEPDAEALYEYYRVFESFKGLSKQHSLESIKGILHLFKDKLIIYRCMNEEGELLALRGYIFEDNRSLDWFAISTEKGRSVYASYGTCWKVIEDATARGIEYYDFSGVDPVGNAGVYNFKRGTGATLIEFAGEYEKSSFFLLNQIFNFIIKKKFKSA